MAKNLGSGIQRMLDNAEQIASDKEQYPKKESEVTINFKIPKSLHTELKIYSAQNDISIKDLAIRLFRQEIIDKS